MHLKVNYKSIILLKNLILMDPINHDIADIVGVYMDAYFSLGKSEA